MTENVHNLKEALNEIKKSGDRSRISEVIGVIAKEVPKRLESLELYELGLDVIGSIDERPTRRNALFKLAKSIPPLDGFKALYARAMEAAITEADAIDDKQHRITELTRLAGELSKTEDMLPLRVLAWRLALGLADKPRYEKPDLAKVSKELPKTLDYSFYRRYTLLGVALQMPNEHGLSGVYDEAITLAIDAALVIEEPVYSRYALMAIFRQVKEGDEFRHLKKRAVEETYRASTAVKDPFAREHALIDLIAEIPKTTEYRKLLQKLLDEALNFFTARKWVEDLDFYDVVDFVLSAEELGMKESKKRRFLREKYADNLSVELEKFGLELNDTRFIETLSPFTHVWIKPKGLRDTVKRIVDHLTELSNTYHGREILRPVLLREENIEPRTREAVADTPRVRECISIDLGATNTVVMRKKAGAQPEFVELGPISKSYDDTYIVPTVLSSRVNAIGGEVNDENPLVNIKQMLLDGNSKGREYVERFLKILGMHIRRSVVGPGWFSMFTKADAEVFYITVPVGFTDYKKAVKSIATKVFKGTRTEYIEEPLAAAVGYQVAEEREKVLMVVDFGGATLDTMIVRLNLNEVHVVAKPDMAMVLGGHDIDLWLAEHLAKKAGIPADSIPYSLVAAAEEIKISLSRMHEVPFVWEGTEVARISRHEFEEILDAHDFYRSVDRAVSYITAKAGKVGLSKERIEAVLLTGGSSQIPSFKDKIGDLFPTLRIKNQIYDHSPLSAVSRGAALYGTRDVVDRHLGINYAIRYATVDKEALFSYSIVLEKGTSLPFEKTFGISPAGKLGEQDEITLELFEVPDSLVARRWVREGEVEYLKQELSDTKNIVLNGLKTITLPFYEPLQGGLEVTFRIDETGNLTVSLGTTERAMESGLRLQ